MCGAPCMYVLIYVCIMSFLNRNRPPPPPNHHRFRTTTTPTTHPDQVWSAAWSPVAALVASGSQSGKVNVWDVSNRANPVLTVLDTNAVARFVYSVAFVSGADLFRGASPSCLFVVVGLVDVECRHGHGLTPIDHHFPKQTRAPTGGKWRAAGAMGRCTCLTSRRRPWWRRCKVRHRIECCGLCGYGSNLWCCDGPAGMDPVVIIDRPPSPKLMNRAQQAGARAGVRGGGPRAALGLGRPARQRPRDVCACMLRMCAWADLFCVCVFTCQPSKADGPLVLI